MQLQLPAVTLFEKGQVPPWINQLLQLQPHHVGVHESQLLAAVVLLLLKGVTCRHDIRRVLCMKKASWM